jgi:hypothetical protein
MERAGISVSHDLADEFALLLEADSLVAGLPPDARVADRLSGSGG